MRCSGRVQARQGALQHEGLAVTHLRLGGTPRVLGVGGVQGAVGPGEGGHLAGATNRVGHRVLELLERNLLQQLLHVPGDAVGGQLGGGPVDGHGGGGGLVHLGAGGVLREQGVVRVGERVLAAVDADFTGEHHGFALANFAGGGPGVEEGKLHLRADERRGCGHAKEAALLGMVLGKVVLPVGVGVARVGCGRGEGVDARVVLAGCLPAQTQPGCPPGGGARGGGVGAAGGHGHGPDAAEAALLVRGGVGEPVGDGHLGDFAAAGRHGAGAHVHHARDDGDVLPLNEFGEGAELAARQVLAREVFEHLADRGDSQVRGDGLGAGGGQVLFEGRVLEAVLGGVARQGTTFGLRGN